MFGSRWVPGRQGRSTGKGVGRHTPYMTLEAQDLTALFHDLDGKSTVFTSAFASWVLFQGRNSKRRNRTELTPSSLGRP